MTAEQLQQILTWNWGLAGSRDDQVRRRKWRKIPNSVRTMVMERDGRCCQICGSTEWPTLDHIVPRRWGGLNADWNLWVLCAPCNSRKGDHLPLPWLVPIG